MSDDNEQCPPSAVLTVRELAANTARKNPGGNAIIAPGRQPLTYKDLMNQIDTTVEFLNGANVGRNDRIAMVLPNGPEAAVAFLAVSAVGTSAPLNPHLQAEEYEFLLSDLKPRALLIQSDLDSPAIDIAEKRKTSILRLSPVLTGSSGLFTLRGETNEQPARRELAQPNDTALVLHTSGTTSRPKMVPLTNANLCTSAQNIRTALELTQADRCLNVMPLFHIHGLIGALLSTISAGACIFCAPGFYAPKFYDWLKECRPTWYTAVPTIHQAILARSKTNLEIIHQSHLRLIRSSSSALPPQVMTELERTFNVPVIESYGMTEASHQMASNPLPPRTRKPGSVGPPAGPEIEVMDSDGNLLSHGKIGEIVIRGPTVMSGYDANPEANNIAFVNGWFRTGDQGYLDQDNFLTITGRIKEIINRGGEKISPKEIDETLLNHPSVAQAVAFGVPHPKLGEDVAAAIVLRDGHTTTEQEIQRFVAKRLADYKIPHQIIFLKEIPKGATGKIQRIGLAQRLGLTESKNATTQVKTEYEAPSNPLEEKIAQVWSQILELKTIGVNDNFFELGGDSVQAKAIVHRLRGALQVREIPLAIFLYAPTIRKMASLLSSKDFQIPQASLVAIQPTGSKPSAYFVHACEGEVLFLTNLAHRLGSDQPFYALRARGLDRNTVVATRVEEMAAHYLEEIQAIQPHGPYILGGAGVGGIVAWEIAQRLRVQDADVAALILIETRLPQPIDATPVNRPYNSLESMGRLLHKVWYYLNHTEAASTLTKRILGYYGRHMGKFFMRRFRVWDETQKAVDRYAPKPYSGRTILLVPENKVGFGPEPKLRIDAWRRLAVGSFEAHVVPGEHLNIFQEPYVAALAEHVRTCLDNSTNHAEQ